MADWTALSERGRTDIQAKLMAALNSLGIKDAVARWIKPPQLPHWQLIIETAWCNNKSRPDVRQALEQAMARAQMQAPENGVILEESQIKLNNLMSKSCRIVPLGLV